MALQKNNLDETLFYTSDELKKTYKNKEYNVVVWGTGEVAETVYQTLIQNDISIDYFADNSEIKQGRSFHGKRVLSAKETAELNNPFVMIGSFSFRPVMEQLTKLGVKNIYALIDSFKYPYQQLKDEQRKLSIYFRDYSSKISDRVLVEAYGNIGDVIVRGGIFRFLTDYYGKDNVYFLVETETIAEFAKCFTEHVYVMNKIKAETNSEYRYKLLKQLNEQYFKMSIILCDIRLHSTRRLLNQYNFNVIDIRYHNILPKNEILVNLDIEFIRKEFYLDDSQNLSAQGCLNENYNPVIFPYKLPDRYVAVNMGASKIIRHYDVRKFSFVARYLIDIGYHLVILGDGEYDKSFFTDLINILGKDENIKSYVSELSLIESIYVVANAAFFVGTESGLWNASYILEKKSVVIYGGGDYGNFKHQDSNIHYVSIDDHSCFGCKWYCTNKKENGYPRCIDDVTPQMIIDEIDKIAEVDCI